jgi:hypothetical protein
VLVPIAFLLLLLPVPPTIAQQPEQEEEIPAEIVSKAEIGDVVFPHAFHYEEMGLACEECHHETDAAKLAMPASHDEYMEDFWLECDTCHHPERNLDEPQTCSLCHEAEHREATDQTLSSKVVIHRSCWQCHEVGTGQGASQACDFCHQPTAESS